PAALRKEQVAPTAGETPAIQQLFVLRWIGCLLDWMRLASSMAGGLKKRTGRTLCRRDACNPAALSCKLYLRLYLRNLREPSLSAASA
ncbi:MAG: hypothetical protein WC944_07225, partial [Candidatus Cloacimonadaceae bacterium]